MTLFTWWCSCIFILSFSLLHVPLQGTSTTTFTFVNSCNYTVWPAVYAQPDETGFNTTGFELPRESSESFQIPDGTSILRGRIWARTGCKPDPTGFWSCRTGDCGTGAVECNGGTGPSKPFTQAEYALGIYGGSENFYDVSLVDGFNVPMSLEAVGGSGGTAGCTVDLNMMCPEELALKDGAGCMDPCSALGSSEYCCIGAYAAVDRCSRPNIYTELFKAACPASYSSYFDDDAAFSSDGGDFVLTFCPSSSFFSS